MKVMCINDDFAKDGFDPSVGEVVTICGESRIHKGNVIIEEYKTNRFGQPQSYSRKHFIPLSDIDETELAEQREELQTA